MKFLTSLIFLLSGFAFAEPSSNQRYYINESVSLHDLALMKANLKADSDLKTWFFHAPNFFVNVKDRLEWARVPEEPYKDQDFYIPFGQTWKYKNKYSVSYDWNKASYEVELRLHWELVFDSFSKYGVVEHTKQNAKLLCLPLLNHIAASRVLKPWDFGHSGYTKGKEPDEASWSKELTDKTTFTVLIRHTNADQPGNFGSHVSCSIGGREYERFSDDYWSKIARSGLPLTKALENVVNFSMKGNW